MSALCVGKSWLFDSTDPLDHDQAAKLCAACPLREDCHAEAQRLRRLTGTWAGRLYGASGRAAHISPREEEMFTDEEARKAHNDWNSGIQNDRTRIGERVYQRRRYQARKAKRAAS